MGVVELKVRAYDILVNIQQLQNELLKVNQELANVVKDEVIKEATEKMGVN